MSLSRGEGRSPVTAMNGNEEYTVYIRAEVVPETQSLEEALDKANPQDDENVMNTHYVDVR